MGLFGFCTFISRWFLEVYSGFTYQSRAYLRNYANLGGRVELSYRILAKQKQSGCFCASLKMEMK